MPGLVAYSVTGLGFLALSAIESFPSSPFSIPSLSTPLHLRFSLTLLLSVFSFLSSLFSLLPSPHTSPLSLPLSLTSLSVSSLFLLYSLSGLLSLSSTLPFPFPSSLLDLLAAFAFGQELLSFWLGRTNPDGIESRFFDLLLVPILVCLISTLILVHRPFAAAPRLARAAGLALQGTWFIQMGFSFFTSEIAHGCALHSRSRADYTIKCKTHEEYHRARAIATLQFNCHLALMLIVGAGVYAAAVGRNRRAGGYRPLGKEVQMEGFTSRFSLDSDEEREEEREEEIAAAEADGANGDELALHESNGDRAEGAKGERI